MPQTSIPIPALLLGAAGLLPFIATALQIVTGWPLSPRLTGPALYHLTVYAAVILSFLGGVQWGMAAGARTSSQAADWRQYGMSMLPSLVAWLALWLSSGFLASARTVLLILAASHGLWLVYDLWTVRQGEAPEWFARLRMGLTGVAATCLVAAALFGPFG